MEKHRLRSSKQKSKPNFYGNLTLLCVDKWLWFIRTWLESLMAIKLTENMVEPSPVAWSLSLLNLFVGQTLDSTPLPSITQRLRLVPFMSFQDFSFKLCKIQNYISEVSLQSSGYRRGFQNFEFSNFFWIFWVFLKRKENFIWKDFVNSLKEHKISNTQARNYDTVSEIFEKKNSRQKPSKRLYCKILETDPPIGSIWYHNVGLCCALWVN